MHNEDATAGALTDAELDAILERCRAASPGPWTSVVEGRDQLSGSSFIQVGSGATRRDDIELSGATVADQDFIASARTDVERLVAEVRRLRGLLERG